MTEFPYIRFNKSSDQRRHLGACGGRTYGRNQRARRALLATAPQAVPPPGRATQNDRPIHPLSARPDVSVPVLAGAGARVEVNVTSTSARPRHGARAFETP